MIISWRSSKCYVETPWESDFLPVDYTYNLNHDYSHIIISQMASEPLPKFMFLNEDSQEMSDLRIRTQITYKEHDKKAEKIPVKRVHNTIPTAYKPNSKGIFNLEYSNKYGVLLQSTEDKVLVVDD